MGLKLIDRNCFPDHYDITIRDGLTELEEFAAKHNLPPDDYNINMNLNLKGNGFELHLHRPYKTNLQTLKSCLNRMDDYPQSLCHLVYSTGKYFDKRELDLWIYKNYFYSIESNTYTDEEVILLIKVTTQVS